MKLSGFFYLALIISVLTVSCSTKNNPANIYRVMTFNIRYGLADDGENSWQFRRDLVFDVIENYHPDLIGLQEALRFQLDELQKHFPDYMEIGVGRDGGTEGEYSAIFYNKKKFTRDTSGTFWLSQTPAVPSADWGNHFFRICTWAHLQDRTSSQSLYFYNTHLDHQSQPAREKGVQLIMKTIGSRREQDPVILCGDFNAGEANPAIEFIKQSGRDDRAGIKLMDSYRLLHPGEKRVGTFNGFSGESGGEKIDYIFISTEIRTHQAEIVHYNRQGRYPSDHFPVWAKVEITD